MMAKPMKCGIALFNDPVSNKYPYFVGRLYFKLMTIQILCIIPLVRRAVFWLLVGMYDNRTWAILKK